MYELETYELKNGSHADREKGMCAMEFVAYLAGEPHSDAPQCACPVLTKYVIRLNDKFSDEERQLLKPYLKRIIGTRDGKALDRAKLLAWKAGTVFAPIALEIGGYAEHAKKLRETEYYNFKELRGRCRSAADAAASDGAAIPYAYAAAYAAYAADAADAAAAVYAADAAACAVTADQRKKVFEEALKALDEAINL